MISPQKVQAMWRMRKQKIPIVQIAKVVGMSRTSIYAYLKDRNRGEVSLQKRTRKSKLDFFELEYIRRIYLALGSNSRSVSIVLNNEFELRNIDMTVNQSTVRRYIKSRLPEIYVNQIEEIRSFSVEPGQQIQIDFLQCKFRFAGDDRQTKIYLFEAIYAHSRHGFVRVCRDMKQQSWYLSIIECLYKNGVPLEILCDNDKSLVVSIKRNKPIYNNAFLTICHSVDIKPHACKPGSPQTKGRVERYGRYLRSSLAIAETRGNIYNIYQLQNYFDDWIPKDEKERTVEIGGKTWTIAEAWEEERKYLKSPKGSFTSLFAYAGEIRVGDDGFITLYGTRHYLGYGAHGRIFNCYVFPSGKCILIPPSANNVMTLTIQKENILNFSALTNKTDDDYLQIKESFPSDDKNDLDDIADLLEKQK